MKNKEIFKNFMIGLGEIFDKAISPTLMDIYWKTMEPFSDERCKEAFNRVIATSKFFPRPAEVLELLRGSAEDNGMVAWLTVEKAIRQIGPYKSVRFEDPVIHSVIESLGGWPDFQNFTDDELKWRQREFLTRYRAMSGRSDHPAYLPGIVEIDNSHRGYKNFIEPPVTVRQLTSRRVSLLQGGKRGEGDNLRLAGQAG